jgi:putative ABC transport system permease protein
MDGTYTVSAVMDDVPQNSHFSFTILLPLHTMLQSNQYRKDDGWGWNNFTTYIQLNDHADKASAESKLADFCKRRLDPKWKDAGGRVEITFQPLRDIHLHPGLRHDVDTVSPDTIYFFGIIALFILCMAWINYINLSTARAMERAREVGIKKSIGAFRSELIAQFLVESVLINFAGIVLAGLLALALLPVLGEMIGKTLAFDFGDRRLWIVLFGLFTIGTLASGVYPALVLSSFRIASALKASRQPEQGFSLRKTLVVFQFACSLILIAGTFVVYRQINFMQTRDTGLQMDQMLIVSAPGTLPWQEAKQKLALLKEEARKIPGIQAMATSGAIPGGGHNWGADIRKSGTPLADVKLGSVVWIDPDFIGTYNIPFVAGKNFDPAVRSTMQSVIINEASLTAFALGTAEQALNEELILQDDTVRIIGVLKNYNWSSLKSEFVPFLFKADTIVPGTLSFHLSAQSIPATVARIGQLYKDILPNDPFEYQFLDDAFNAQYKSDRQFGNIFGLFAILAVSISCLGLWGLASFTTTQKLKEIGVRKVLGASRRSILWLLSVQFLRLIGIAAALALPFAAYGMQQWLQRFAFHTALQWDLFAFPVLLLTSVALFTVSIQVLKGASVNPVNVLKSE